MARITLHNLDDDLFRQLRIRAARHERSVEAEVREILRLAVLGSSDQQSERQHVADRLAEFRHRTGGRGSPSVEQLLEESRADRTNALTGHRPTD